MVVSWREVRWIWRMRQNFVTQFIQLLKHWLCDVQSGVVVEENWAHSVDDYWLWVLQFWCISSTCRAYFSDVLVSPWFGKMQWIRWAADHQTVTMTFTGCKFGFGKCFGASSWSSHWAGRCWLSYKIYFSLHITIWLRNGSLLLCTVREDNTSEWWFFLIDGQFMRHLLIKLFHLSSLLQMLNDYSMVDMEFSCGCERISFGDPLNWLLSTSDGHPRCSSSSGVSSLQNFLNHYCTVCSLAVFGPNALLMLWVVSDTLQPILN